MSWLLGLSGESISDTLRARVGEIHGVPLHFINTPTLYLSAGGLKDTCLAGNCSDTIGSGYSWMMVGLGIMLQENSCRFLDSADWTKLLSEESTRPSHT